LLDRKVHHWRGRPYCREQRPKNIDSTRDSPESIPPNVVSSGRGRPKEGSNGGNEVSQLELTKPVAGGQAGTARIREHYPRQACERNFLSRNRDKQGTKSQWALGGRKTGGKKGPQEKPHGFREAATPILTTATGPGLELFAACAEFFDLNLTARQRWEGKQTYGTEKPVRPVQLRNAHRGTAERTVQTSHARARGGTNPPETLHLRRGSNRKSFKED